MNAVLKIEDALHNFIGECCSDVIQLPEFLRECFSIESWERAKSSCYVQRPVHLLVRIRGVAKTQKGSHFETTADARLKALEQIKLVQKS